jgi:hypothetical protein
MLVALIKIIYCSYVRLLFSVVHIKEKKKHIDRIRFLVNMGSSSSPPLLYLTDDDDDDNETEQNISYGNSFSAMINDNLPRKKRKLTNTNVHINPSIVNWSKRQRNDHYHQPHPTPQNLINHDRDIIVINPNEYHFEEQDPHSFLAFDWSSDARTSTRIHQHPFHTASRMPIVPLLPPPSNVMNVVKHHLDHSDAIPLIPSTRQHDRYAQQSQSKLNNIPRCSSPPSTLLFEIIHKLNIIFSIFFEQDFKINNVISDYFSAFTNTHIIYYSSYCTTCSTRKKPSNPFHTICKFKFFPLRLRLHLIYY